MIEHIKTGEDLLNLIDTSYALKLANKIREYGGFATLEDLKSGIPDDPEACVLAQTFNCECFVMGVDPYDGNRSYTVKNPDQSYNDDYLYRDEWQEAYYSKKEKIYWNGSWFVWFKEEKFAKALAEELGEVVYDATDNYGEDRHIYGVRLPKEVGLIATAFDDKKLPQYIKSN